MKNQIILSKEEQNSPITENESSNATKIEHSKLLLNNSIYVDLFSLRYTNEDNDYKRAAITISREPICIQSWGPSHRSYFDESDSFDSRKNREHENNDNNAGRNRNSDNSNWRTMNRRGRGNKEGGNWNDRSKRSWRNEN